MIKEKREDAGWAIDIVNILRRKMSEAVAFMGNAKDKVCLEHDHEDIRNDPLNLKQHVF